MVKMGGKGKTVGGVAVRAWKAYRGPERPRPEGETPSTRRGQDARGTQGRDALATEKTIAQLRLTLPPVCAGAMNDPQRFSTLLRSSRQELRNSSGDMSRKKTRPRVARIRALA
jgi:hypothetical protein